MKEVNSVNLLHVDPHNGNWATLFYMENGKPKVKTKLIDFGETMDISKYGPHDSPWYYPAIAERGKECAVTRDFNYLIKWMGNDVGSDIDFLEKFIDDSDEKNFDQLYFAFQKRKQHIQNLMSSLNIAGPLNLNQRNTLLDTLWSLLRISPNGHGVPINHLIYDDMKGKLLPTKRYKKKQDFMSNWN